MTTPLVSIVISTKNRCDELRRALESCVRQRGPAEIVVLDDGSSDGTSEMVRRCFPEVRLFTFDHSLGYIARRNQGASYACAPFVLSLDDDAELDDDDMVQRVASAFGDPCIGAVTLPYIDVQKGDEVRQRVPDTTGRYVVGAYVGTAHAVRRELFLALGGYRTDLLHQGEESDFCIRMLNAGHFVGMCDAPPIRHYESVRRDFERVDVYGRRNDILFAVWNVPAAFLPAHLAGTIVNGWRHGLRTGRLGTMLRGQRAGLRDGYRLRKLRDPVAGRTYRLHRLLKAGGPLPLERAAALLQRR